jgi:hypothetical protein
MNLTPITKLAPVSNLNLAAAADRYRAVSMEFAADLDAHNVEMRILTSTGKTIVIVCPRDSIFTVQQHIEKIGRACPQIATWSDVSCARRRLEGFPSFPQRELLKQGTS